MTLKAPPADLVEEWFIEMFKHMTREARREVVRQLMEIHFELINFAKVEQKK